MYVKNKNNVSAKVIKIGEKTRTNHRGKPVIVNGDIFSTKIDSKKTNEYDKKYGK